MTWDSTDLSRPFERLKTDINGRKMADDRLLGQWRDDKGLTGPDMSTGSLWSPKDLSSG